MSVEKIPFVKPTLVGTEKTNIDRVLSSDKMSGDGPFTHQCHAKLKGENSIAGALLTHSCTAALEMAAMLSNIQPGDEVIMPSFTFVSTANAIVLRGGVPVFVDIRQDTFNLNEKLVEAAITKLTKAILPVHYAGVACEMDVLLKIAKDHNLRVIEDAAQGYQAFYKGSALGTIGDFGTLSFHQTKNVICGEGGALYVKTKEDLRRAEIIREKGTDRSLFLRGEVDKYCWRDIGSSFLPSELNAAFLLSQLEAAEKITRIRLALWQKYDEAFSHLGENKQIQLPKVPASCQHNGHIYPLVFPTPQLAIDFTEFMRLKGIQCVFHYVPLHNSPGGIKFARSHGNLKVTEFVGSNLVRLPLWTGLESCMNRIIENVISFIEAELPMKAMEGAEL